MARTVVAMFDSFTEAQDAVQDLMDNGIPRDHISVVGNDASGEYSRAHGGTTGDATYEEDSAAAEGAGAGAVGGTVVGGVLGLLVGIGALAIPGIGPVIAAGPLLAAVGATAAGAGIGAAAGGLLGALVGAGVPEEDAHMYTEGVRRGGTLITVTTDENTANTAYSVLHRHNAVDVDERGTAYRDEGWERFDPNAEPYNAAAGAGSYPTDRGDTDRSEWSESSKVGTATGTAAGAATGAAIGSVGGPVGTVVGGVAGAATGAGVGAAGDAAGEAAEDESRGEDDVNRTQDHSTASRRVNEDIDADPRITTGYDTAHPTRGTDVTGMGNTAATTGYDTAGTTRDTDVSDVGTTAGTTGYDTTGAGPVGYAASEDDTARRPRVQVYDSDARSRVNYERTNDVGGGADSADSNYAESSKAGTATGGVAGAATGAAIGAAGGPVGAVVGGVAGAVTGAGVGAAGDAAGEAAEDDNRRDDDAVVSDDTVASDDTVVSDDADSAAPGRKGQVSPGDLTGTGA